jgi:hypothetical protein
MSESAREILEGLKDLLKPKSRWPGGRNRSSAPTAAVDPHGYTVGVRDDLEILERAEETWLLTYARDLVNQRRLKRADKFWIAIPGYEPNTKTNKLWLGDVLFADGQCRYFEQRGALLDLRQHVGRVIHLTNRINPLSHELLMGYEQPVTIARHGLAWIETAEEVDTSKFVYPIAVFQ